jgi:hypothetical protein
VKPWVDRAKETQPRQGRQKMNGWFYLSPLPGLGWFLVFDPRFHRGLLSAAPPALLKENQSGRGESEGLAREHDEAVI